MKQTLLLDLDDVCCPFTDTFLVWYEFQYSVELPQPTSYYQYKELINQYLQKYGIFRHIPLMRGCYEVLNKHLCNYNYVVVTSRPAQHHLDTINWVKEYLPPVESIIFTDSGSKWRIEGDVIIDDNPEVITSFMLKQPYVWTVKMKCEYNKHVHGNLEVSNWTEIDLILDQLSYNFLYSK